MLAALFSAQEPEYPFNIDVELLWNQLNRTQNINLVDYNRPFCSCSCGGNSVYASDIIGDLDRSLALRFTLAVKNKETRTLELRGTTPMEFEETTIYSSLGDTHLSCDLAYGYNHVGNYTPLLNLEEYYETISSTVGGITVSEIFTYYDTDYVDADEARLYFNNSYYTIEANGWNHLTPRWKKYFSASYGFGLRYFSINNSFKEKFYKGIDTSFFSSKTVNDLFGLQFLMALELHPYSWMNWGIRVDAGAFVSHVKFSFELNDYNASEILTRYKRQSIENGFYGDLEVFLQCKFLDRAYFLFSYGGLLISDIAQAINNINLTTAKFDINTSGNIIYQYWSVGLGYDF